MPDDAASGVEPLPGAAPVAGQDRAETEGVRGGRTRAHRESPAPKTETVSPREGTRPRQQGAPQRKETAAWRRQIRLGCAPHNRSARDPPVFMHNARDK